jgi:hypothetical protein
LKNKEIYKDSEYGFVYVIGIPKDAKATNDGCIKIDVLIIKVSQERKPEKIFLAKF